MAYVSLDSEQIKRANKKHKYTKEQVEQLEKCMDENTGPLFFMKTFMKIQQRQCLVRYSHQYSVYLSLSFLFNQI